MRKLATAAAVSLALASSGVWALGLGDIEMRSALNQPMNAEILLKSVKPGEANGMIVKLASPEAFARAGIDRDGPLVDLRFSVDTERANPVILISSQKPIIEPFLNFLLEVEWPQGKMVREYTVLLDPPVFMSPNATSRNQANETPVITESTDTSLLTPTPVERSDSSITAEDFEVELVGTGEEISDNQSVGEVVVGEVISIEEFSEDNTIPAEGELVTLTDLAEPNVEAQTELAQQTFDIDSIPDVEIVGSAEEVSDTFSVSGDQSGVAGEIVALEEGEIISLEEFDSGSSASGSVTVNQGDTLAAIAQANSVAGVSPEQLMLALLAANNGAFINNNINLVKAGAVLRIPTAAEANGLSQSQALAEIGSQNQLWQEYRDSVRSAGSTRLASQNNSQTAPSTNDADTDASQSSSEAAAEESTEAASEAAESNAGGDELRIVADSEPTSTAASATADESTESDAQQLGSINRKLQLAREELASSQLEAGDLGDQANELDTTSEKLDALVNLRQDEVAKLEEQLRLAREQEIADAEAAEAEAEAKAAAAEQEVDTAVADAAADTATTATEAAATAAAALASAAAAAAGDSSEDASAETDTETEAVQEAEVAVDDTDAQAVVETATENSVVAEPQPVAKRSWMDALTGGSKGILAIAGLGLLAILGLIATLLFRRRNKVEEIDFDAEVDFIDDHEAAELQAEVNAARTDVSADVDANENAGVGGAAAAVAATGAAAATASFAGAGSDQPLAEDDDDIDKDDTISEVDVYLAYGLHGQAEELLGKAMESDPHNQEYQYKLLETYHAQRNSDAFGNLAGSYAEKFGSAGNPQWGSVAAMGNDLDPSNTLFAGAVDSIESVGVGGHDAAKLSDDDFNVDSSEGFAGSVSREFGNDDAGDESALMDQSLDPAFAFDETDLEATGDFSQMANELSDEASETLDFPDVAESSDGIGGAVAGAVGGVAAGAAGLAASASDKASDALDFDEAMTLDEFDVGEAAASNGADLGAVADDLTLDLDKLSGDMELDGTELLDGELGELEMPDLTADNSLTDIAASPATDSDEMDTMMDLAKAYIDMGDKDSASSALGEIVKSGSPAQVTEAETLLRKIS